MGATYRVREIHLMKMNCIVFDKHDFDQNFENSFKRTRRLLRNKSDLIRTEFYVRNLFTGDSKPYKYIALQNLCI